MDASIVAITNQRLRKLVKDGNFSARDFGAAMRIIKDAPGRDTESMRADISLIYKLGHPSDGMITMNPRVRRVTFQVAYAGARDEAELERSVANAMDDFVSRDGTPAERKAARAGYKAGR